MSSHTRHSIGEGVSDRFDELRMQVTPQNLNDRGGGEVRKAVWGRVVNEGLFAVITVELWNGKTITKLCEEYYNCSTVKLVLLLMKN